VHNYHCKHANLLRLTLYRWFKASGTGERTTISPLKARHKPLRTVWKSRPMLPEYTTCPALHMPMQFPSYVSPATRFPQRQFVTGHGHSPHFTAALMLVPFTEVLRSKPSHWFVLPLAHCSPRFIRSSMPRVLAVIIRKHVVDPLTPGSSQYL